MVQGPNRPDFPQAQVGSGKSPMAAKKRAKGSAAARPPRQPDLVADPLLPGNAPAPSQPARAGPPIVGISASAGGPGACARFLAAMPADSGLAFVLLLPLDPPHKSLTIEWLARHTAMPVVEATDNMAVEANRVHVIPPDQVATIHAGFLRLTGPVQRLTAPTAIGRFLRSPADDPQERAICIMHSGTGAHGAPSLKAIKATEEELHSLNEELITVNNQLQEKVQELEMANNDMADWINCTDVATVFLDSEFRIKRFTPAATQLFHLLASDLGRPLGDIVARFRDPDLLADAGRVLAQLTASEKEVATAEGAWWCRRIMPYRTRDQRAEGVVITFVDITEPRRAADTTVRRLAAIVEGSADAIFSKDLDGTIRTWNQAAERLYGYTPEEAVGQSVEMLVPGDRVAEWFRIMALLRSGECIEGLETERLRKDGQRIPVRVTVSPVRDRTGKVVSASTIARDVSEPKRARQELRDNQDRLQAILDAAVDAILTLDEHGIIRSVNAATERMFGYAADELIGHNVKVLMPPPYADEHDGYLERYRRTGQKHIIGIGREVQGRRKDGSTFPVDLAVSEIADQGQHRFTGILRDLSARKELEQEVLEVATLEQQRIGQELHDTSAQELTALQLLAESVLPALKEKSPAEARIVSKMAEGLRRVLGQVRAVSRGLIRVEVDAEGLMAALAELAAQTTELHGIRCTFDCKDPVPLADNHIATQLYSIAREGVSNALEHAQAHNILISLAGDDQWVTLRVQDDGVGLPKLPIPIKGMGLKIMRYRAGLINAHLSVHRAEPGGTVVACTYHRGTGHVQEERQGEQAGGPGADRR